MLLSAGPFADPEDASGGVPQARQAFAYWRPVAGVAGTLSKDPCMILLNLNPSNPIGTRALSLVATPPAVPLRAAMASLPRSGDLQGRAQSASLSMRPRTQLDVVQRSPFAGAAAWPVTMTWETVKPLAAAPDEPGPELDVSGLEIDLKIQNLIFVVIGLTQKGPPAVPEGAKYKNLLKMADPLSLLNPSLAYPVALDEKAQARLKVTIKDGLLRDAEGRLVDTRSAPSKPGEAPLRAHYVMDPAGSVYLSNDRRPAAYGLVAAAGEIHVEEGVVKEVSRKSALYQPDEQHLEAFVRELVSRGVPLTFVIDPQAGYRIQSMSDTAFESWQLRAELKKVLAAGKPRAAPEGAKYPQVIEISEPSYLDDLPASVARTPATMLTADEKASSRLTVRDGLLLGADGQPFDSSGAVANQAGQAGCARYVMDHNGTLYASNQAHLMLPEPVAAAGEIRVQQGRVLMVNKTCPVYEPKEVQLDALVHCLETQGVAPSFAVERGSTTPRSDLLLREFRFESLLDELRNQQILKLMADLAAHRLAEGAVPAVPPNAAYAKGVDIRRPEKILDKSLIPAVLLYGERLQDTQATLVNGRVCTASGLPWDTQGATTVPGAPADRARYIMDHSGNIHISNHVRLIVVEPVAAAGEISIRDGVIQAISRRDDVYAPDEAHLEQFMHRLLTQGVPPGFQVEW